MHFCDTCAETKDSGTIVGGGVGWICRECACSVLRSYGCHNRANQLDGGATSRPLGLPDAEELAGEG